MNQNTVGWTKFTSFLEDFGLNEIADKSRNPFTGAYAGYFQW
jgi:hypothetical protein